MISRLRFSHALVVLLVIAIVSIERLTAGRKRWVHPQVYGKVLDEKTGDPIAGAKISFIESKYGGGETTSSYNGEYNLDAVSESYRFAIYGDALFISTIECTAEGYRSERREYAHGPIGVWGRHSIVEMDFSLVPR